MKRNVYLAGFMGTGKSTIGKELALLLGRKFIDMDKLLEERLKLTIPEIFAQYGENFFRAEERKLAFELTQTANKVIATGGGTITDGEVLDAFKKTGIVICLVTGKEELLNRLERSTKRPLLADNPRKRAEELLEKRKAIFEKISLKVDTTDLTPKEAAKKIVQLLKLCQKILDQLQSQYILLS